MNNKILACVSAAFCAATVCYAGEMTDDELRAAGGTAFRPDVGAIAVLDAQSDVSKASVYGFSLVNGSIVHLPFRYQRIKGFDLFSAASAVAGSKANAAIFLIDDARLPMSLIAPEDRWGALNLAPLKADSPTREVLIARTDKMFTRVAVLTLGGANQDVESCAMRSVLSLKDLDKLSGSSIAQLTMPGMLNHVRNLGITLGYEVTYEDACIEGWAKPPTNDFQKAIWDRVHQLPTKPLTIKPEK